MVGWPDSGKSAILDQKLYNMLCSHDVDASNSTSRHFPQRLFNEKRLFI
jgi:hypothetical protein